MPISRRALFFGSGSRALKQWKISDSFEFSSRVIRLFIELARREIGMDATALMNHLQSQCHLLFFLASGIPFK